MYLFSEKKLTLLVLFPLCFFKLANCVRFSLNLNQLEFKCIYESMSANTLILFDSISKEDINIIISDEKNTLLDQKEKHTKAAFSTIRNGIHRFCFANLSKNTNKVDIVLKWGPSARDSKSIANKGDIEPIEEIIKDINIALKEYQEGVKQIKRVTSEIRKVTSSASRRIAVFSLINILSIVAINLVQAMYTKRFFKSRKLI